jgi:hypothetical protein
MSRYSQTALVVFLAMWPILAYVVGCQQDPNAPPAPAPVPVPAMTHLTIEWSPYEPMPGFAAIRIYRGIDVCGVPDPLPALEDPFNPPEQAAVQLDADGHVANQYVDNTVPAVPGSEVCYELDAVNGDGTPSPTRSNRAGKVLS